MTCLNEVFQFTRIWVTENFFNIHTVKSLPSKRACILYQCDSKLMENRLSGMLCKIRDLEIFSSFSLSWVSVFLLSKYLGINFNFSVWRLQFKVLDRLSDFKEPIQFQLNFAVSLILEYFHIYFWTGLFWFGSP